MKNLRIAIIGYGYWGPNLVRNFLDKKNCVVTHVVDKIPERLEKLKLLHSNIDITQSFEQVVNNPDIDAVVIATPVSTHYDLVRISLECNKHVLVEKPMADSFSNAEKLIELSKKMKKVLMVDHTYLYTGSIQKIKQFVDDGTLGEIQYIDSTRINLGLFQSDINVLWDLATHDISICTYLIKEKPIAVQAIGKSHTNSNLEDIAYLTLHYNSNKIMHFNCSWISPVKVRHMLISGDKKMILFNDLETTEKVKVYDTQFKAEKISKQREILTDYRVGDVYVPKVSREEGLSLVADDFLNAILTNSKPISDYELGLQVVKILEAAQKSIKNDGIMISI